MSAQPRTSRSFPQHLFVRVDGDGIGGPAGTGPMLPGPLRALIEKQQQPDLGSSGTRRGQAADTKSELCDVRTAACCRSCRAIRSLQNGPVSIAIMCSVQHDRTGLRGSHSNPKPAARVMCGPGFLGAPPSWRPRHWPTSEEAEPRGGARTGPGCTLTFVDSASLASCSQLFIRSG